MPRKGSPRDSSNSATDLALDNARPGDDIVVTRITVKHGHPPLSQEQCETYLTTLAATGSRRKACVAAGAGDGAFRDLRKENALFAEADNAAKELATDALEDHAHDLAFGVDSALYYQGEQIGVERKYVNNPLLEFLLKAARPDKYLNRTEVTTRADGPTPQVRDESDRKRLLEALEQARLAAPKDDDVEDLL